MLSINNQFPPFRIQAVVPPQENSEKMIELTEQSFAGQWQVYFFWPRDFTFVCPTEIVEFAKLNQAFLERDAVLLGVSTDSAYAHLAWKEQHPELRDLAFPMLADQTHALSTALGILDHDSGAAHRAVFIVDPHNVIRFAMVTDMKVGRNPQEVLRILDALQTDELCPCNWQKGEATIAIA